jgi:hypothetical protein
VYINFIHNKRNHWCSNSSPFEHNSSPSSPQPYTQNHVDRNLLCHAASFHSKRNPHPPNRAQCCLKLLAGIARLSSHEHKFDRLGMDSERLGLSMSIFSLDILLDPSRRRKVRNRILRLAMKDTSLGERGYKQQRKSELVSTTNSEVQGI